MSVPPERVRTLSEKEIEEYRLGQNDPVYQEMVDAGNARELGLSKEEFLRRKTRADRICGALMINEKKASIKVTGPEIVNILRACKQAVVSTAAGK